MSLSLNPITTRVTEPYLRMNKPDDYLQSTQKKLVAQYSSTRL